MFFLVYNTNHLNLLDNYSNIIKDDKLQNILKEDNII